MGTQQKLSLWAAENRSRWFLVPLGMAPPDGPLVIRNLLGETARVDSRDLEPFEVTEDQARRWAKDQLGRTLEELRDGLNESLGELRQKVEAIKREPVKEGTAVTPEAPSALLGLLKQLPGVIAQSLSADQARVESARATMGDLQQRLKAAGIDLDDRFTRFPDRLAALRKEADEERKKASTPAEEKPGPKS
jgi:hypothetical protein